MSGTALSSYDKTSRRQKSASQRSLTLFKSLQQSFTAYPPIDGDGDPNTYILPAGSVYSPKSLIDANNLALDVATQRAINGLDYEIIATIKLENGDRFETENGKIIKLEG